ncbi:MAG: HTTM domain-containing protein [Planctomycetaceae bacterium]|nr:HTTM domain-containing protein [Planctomycetaceae bacterium]
MRTASSNASHSPDGLPQRASGHGIVRRYVDDLRLTTAENWNRFWFTPTDPATLGLIRVLTGAMLVYTHWVWGLDFDSFFGTESWVRSDLVQRYLSYDWVFSFWYIVPPSYAFTVHLVCLGVLVLFAIGLFTRITSILALVIVISYANRVPTALFGLDQINGLLTFYLALGPSGAAYSLDAWRRRRGKSSAAAPIGVAPGLGFDALEPSIHANLAIRLIQVHMCVIYFFAGVSKLQGRAWWDGMAMWLAFSNQEYQTLDMLWLARYPLAINLLTHFTIFWELTYSVFVWVRVLRPLVLFFAVLLHAGIGVCMGMWTFGLIMMVGNLAFVPPVVVRKLLSRRHVVKSFDH